MKKRILIILIIVIVITLIITLTYIKLKNTKSTPTKQIEKSCEIEEYEYKNRKVFKIAPQENTTNNKTILYLHGGAYMAEMTKEHWSFIEKLVQDTGATVILPDYPLAPMYNYKDVFEMIEPLYIEMVNKIDSKNIILMGDSAGGGLCAALLEKLEETIPIPEKTILISPWLDVSMSNKEMEKVQPYDTDLNIESLKVAGISYAAGLNLKNYLVSPIYGDISKLKNVTIFTGTYDILNPDVYELEKKMNEIGESIEVKTYEQAKHNWVIMNNSEEDLIEQGYNDLCKIIN